MSHGTQLGSAHKSLSNFLFNGDWRDALVRHGVIGNEMPGKSTSGQLVLDRVPKVLDVLVASR